METKKSSSILSKSIQKLLGSKCNYRLRYYHQRGHFPNLSNPKDMSEILISQMFSPQVCAEYAPYIDKIEVRNYLISCGLQDCLLEHYGVWNNPEDVDFESLPNQFVLKSNNGCGHHVICHNKSTLDFSEAIRTMHTAILSGINNVEPHYHQITPRIYAEELIDCGDGNLPVDYKFTCIGGEIMDVFVATDRATCTRYCTLDLDWNPLPYIKKNYLPEQLPRKPKHLDKLADVARNLSKKFGFVRVDLYEYHGRPYFSELTFFPWGGLFYGYTNDAISFYGEKYRKLTTNFINR